MPKPANGDYRATGTEDLGSNPSTKHTEPATVPTSGGKDAGGTTSPRVTVQTKRAAWNETPSGGKTHWPSKVDSFNGEKV
jgi:hypothetical protein